MKGVYAHHWLGVNSSEQTQVILEVLAKYLLMYFRGLCRTDDHFLTLSNLEKVGLTSVLSSIPQSDKVKK